PLLSTPTSARPRCASTPRPASRSTGWWIATRRRSRFTARPAPRDTATSTASRARPHSRCSPSPTSSWRPPTSSRSAGRRSPRDGRILPAQRSRTRSAMPRPLQRRLPGLGRRNDGSISAGNLPAAYGHRPTAALSSLLAGQVDILKRRVSSPTHLVLHHHPTPRAAELPELHVVIDEAARVADQGAGGLDRAVDTVAVEFVVVAGGAEGWAAAGAGEPVGAVVLDEIEILGDRAQYPQARAGVRPRLAAEALHERRVA